MLTPIKYGGFGLVNTKDLGDSLDLRSLGRTMESTHPFLMQLSGLINYGEFFNVKVDGNVDGKLMHAIKLLNKDRGKIKEWPNVNVIESVSLCRVLQNLKIYNLLTNAGKQSLHYLAIHRRIRNPCVHQLNANELASLDRFLKDRELGRLIQLLAGTPYLGAVDVNGVEGYPHRSKTIKRLTTMSSKDLRLSRSNDEEINIFKIGLVLDPGELRSWTHRIKRLTSTRHRNLILRVAHGDIFSNSRLCKFGLRDSSGCKNCDEQVETVKHRLMECPKAREAWAKLDEARNMLQVATPSTLTIENILGAGERIDKISLALQAELLLRLSTKSDGYCPQQIAKAATKLVFSSETLSNEKLELYKNWLRQS